MTWEELSLSQGCVEWLGEIWASFIVVNWLEWAKVFFDLIKGIAWPLAIFLLFWMFRLQLGEKIKDLISAGPTGAVFHAPVQAVQAQAAGVVPQLGEHPMSSVTKITGTIQHDLEAIQENARVTVLVRALAETRLFAGFEAIFGVIFGSQITALRELAKGPQNEALAKARFDQEVRPLNEKLYGEWTFEKWADLLLAQELVRREEDVFHITDFGRDFLLFVDTKKAGFVRAN